ncbi:ROK family protein [Streptomyces thinghirensis]|nr:ROK family protein [Streptomyces thinghirensis]
MGEYGAGAATGHDRVVCLTLGTGVGSSFLSAGRPVHSGPGVPPSGHVHHPHGARPTPGGTPSRAMASAPCTAVPRRRALSGSPMSTS